ncbi:MAG: major capsid protein [Bacteroidota bacterium]
MEQSQFLTFIKKWFSATILVILEKINGSENKPNYLHEELLRTEFSVTGMWETVQFDGTLVAADYVSLDSSLPLKSRDSMGSVTGKIPKMGLEKQKNEQEITDLQTMQSQNVSETTLARRIFNDLETVIGGVKERNEASFLQGFSTGITLVQDDAKPGSAVRIDYGYKTENKFGVSTVFSNVASTPLTDIQTRILAKASVDGKQVTRIYTDLATMRNILKTNEAKDLYAVSIGNFGSTKPTPSAARLNEAVQAEYGFQFVVVDRSVTIEDKAGNRSTFKPWQTGMLAATTADVVGALFYATPAEQNARVAGVQYEVVDEYILTSMFRVNRPSVAEITNAQARVAPVVGTTVYTMDSLTVQA